MRSQPIPLRGVLAAVAVFLCVAADPAAGEPTPGYTAIQRAFLREDFQTVVTLAQTFLTEHGQAQEVLRVRIWMALSLDRLQRTREALQTFDDLKRHLPTEDLLWSEVLFWEGDVSRRAFQMVRAKLAFGRLLAHDPDSTWAPLAQQGLGLVDLHQQAFESALKRFREVATHQAGQPLAMEAQLYAGLCHLRLKQFAQAVEVLQPMLEQLYGPIAQAQAAFYLGESLTGVERYDDAVAAYQRAMALAETSQWGRLALFGVGWARLRAGQCEDSVKVFDRYLAQPAADHRTDALFAQANCLMQLGREDEALPRFEQIVTRDLAHPLAVESGVVIADLYRRQGRFSLAKQMLHTLLRRPLETQVRARVQLQLGALALDQGNPLQARTIFQLAAEGNQSPLRQVALNGLGDVAVYLGHFTQAKQYYEDAVRVAPQTTLATYATYQLGRIHLQHGRISEAVGVFGRLIEEASPALLDDVRLALVLAYLNQREKELARSQLEHIRQQSEVHVAARAAYYEALLALGEEDEVTAQQLCQEAITGAPRSEEATDARLLLTDLLARRTSVHDAVEWLTQVYQSSDIMPRQRAKLAKRLGDFAREELLYSEAIRWYDTAMQFLPSLRGEVTYRMASCYEDAGDLEMAIRWYQMVEEPPWRVRGQLAVAKLFERQDRLDAAAVIYERLAEEPIPEAALVRERLAALRGNVTPDEE